MAVTAQNVHLLAHTARMQQVLARDPAHPRKDPYDVKLAEYKPQWADVPPDDRNEIAEIVGQNYPDITINDLITARTALEG